jgi:hypothetical protein
MPDKPADKKTEIKVGNFKVHGHWRTRPDGKRVWIKPYVRRPENRPPTLKD